MKQAAPKGSCETSLALSLEGVVQFAPTLGRVLLSFGWGLLGAVGPKSYQLHRKKKIRAICFSQQEDFVADGFQSPASGMLSPLWHLACAPRGFEGSAAFFWSLQQ